MTVIDEGQRTFSCETVLELRRQRNGNPRPGRSRVAAVSQIESAKRIAMLRIQQPDVVSVESENVRDVLVRVCAARRRDVLPARAIVGGPEEMLIGERPADVRREQFHRSHLRRMRPRISGENTQDRQRKKQSEDRLQHPKAVAYLQRSKKATGWKNE